MKPVTHPCTPLPEAARDAYDLAQERGITPEAGAAVQRQENWQFAGYNDCGQPTFVPPTGDRNAKTKQ